MHCKPGVISHIKLYALFLASLVLQGQRPCRMTWLLFSLPQLRLQRIHNISSFAYAAKPVCWGVFRSKNFEIFPFNHFFSYLTLWCEIYSKTWGLTTRAQAGSCGALWYPLLPSANSAADLCSPCLNMEWVADSPFSSGKFISCSRSMTTGQCSQVIRSPLSQRSRYTAKSIVDQLV